MRLGIIACGLTMIGATACKPPTAVGPDDKVSGSATPAGPTHHALDVPVINASRGDAFLGASGPLVAWTGTEAAFLYTTSDDLTERLWVGRMDGHGKVLDRRPVALESGRRAAPQPDREVDAMLYPRWVDGTLASIFNTRVGDQWIKVAPDGTVHAAEPLHQETGRRLLGTDGAMHSSGRFAVWSLGDGEATHLELYDARAQHVGAVPLDCDTVDNITATDWGYAVSCDGPYSPGEPEAPTSAVLGIRGGKVAWTFGGLPAGRSRSLGSDGQRVLIVESGLSYPVTVKTQVLDGEGRTEAAPTTTQSRALQTAEATVRTREPMIWTGQEFATFVGRLLVRYASDGRPLGEWEVEPRCNRAFEITGLAWTGVAYLVVGAWSWTECIDRRLKHYGMPITDADRLHPLAPGLIWDPATDAVAPPDPTGE